MNFATKVISIVGGTTSAAIDLGGSAIIAVMPDADWAGTTLAFQASMDGTTYVAVQDDAGDALSYTVAASKYTIIPPSKGIGMDLIKIVSGSSETATITILLK